jgi:ERAP1-like C-terminal domain
MSLEANLLIFIGSELPNHRQLIYCTGMRGGNETAFNLLWRRYDTTAVTHEKMAILSALGCTKNETLIKVELNSSEPKELIEFWFTLYRNIWIPS